MNFVTNNCLNNIDKTSKLNKVKLRNTKQILLNSQINN